MILFLTVDQRNENNEKLGELVYGAVYNIINFILCMQSD
jgi:hypothetical protein